MRRVTRCLSPLGSATPTFYEQITWKQYGLLGNSYEYFFRWLNGSHAGQIDHDLDHTDHLDPNLPLGNSVQYLYSADPTRDTCPGSCRLDGSHPAVLSYEYIIQMRNLSICPDVSAQMYIP